MTYKHWLIVSALMFAAGLAWGLLTSVKQPGLLGDQVSSLQQIAGFILPQGKASVLLFIYAKNVLALVASFVLSPLFLLVPVAALTLNGGMLGLVSVAVVQQKSLPYLLAGILPHGVIEIPALIIGEAAALSFGSAAIRAFFGRDKKENLSVAFRRNARYLVIALIMLIPAALIETFITSRFVG